MIEQEFFKAFGIEKRCIEKSPTYCADYDGICEKCRGLGYPEITAEILLKLICIGSTIYPYCLNYRETEEELKDFILNFFIRHKKEVNKKQVKALFEEE